MSPVVVGILLNAAIFVCGMAMGIVVYRMYQSLRGDDKHSAYDRGYYDGQNRRGHRPNRKDHE